MKTVNYIIIGILACSAYSGFASTRVGNGGDTVLCKKSNDNSFVGLFSLDYLATYNLINSNEDVHPVNSWKDSSSRIKKFFDTYMPRISDSWTDYVNHVNNFHDRDRTRFWQARPGRLLDLPDLQSNYIFPENCKEVYQTVVRHKRGDTILYDVDLQYYKELEKRPLQFSFLMLHEFFWDHLDPNNVNDNALLDLNRFIHSNAFESWPSRKIKEYLNTLMDFTNRNDTGLSKELDVLVDLIIQAASPERIKSYLDKSLYKNDALYSFLYLTDLLKKLNYQDKQLIQLLGLYDRYRFSSSGIDIIGLMILLNREDAAIYLLENGYENNKFIVSVILASRHSTLLNQALVRKGYPELRSVLNMDELLGEFTCDLAFAYDDVSLMSKLIYNGLKYCNWRNVFTTKAKKVLEKAVGTVEYQKLILPPHDTKFSLEDCGHNCYKHYKLDAAKNTGASFSKIFLSYLLTTKAKSNDLAEVITIPGLRNALRREEWKVEIIEQYSSLFTRFEWKYNRFYSTYKIDDIVEQMLSSTEEEHRQIGELLKKHL